MVRKLRLFLLLSMLVASFAALGARPANACTCATFDTRRAVADSAGAFVGRLVPADVLPTPEPDGETKNFQFRVDEMVKGPFAEGDIVEVRSAASPAACGLSASKAPVGLILQRQDTHWTGSLCQQVDPARLRRVKEPLPGPDGPPPPTVVIESSYGTGRSFGLDRQGRLTAYGPGIGTTAAAVVCPEAPRRPDGTFAPARLAELFFIPGDGGVAVPAVAVRDTETLALISEASLPDYAGGVPASAAIGCRNADGTDLVVALSDPAAQKGRIVRVLNNTHRVVWDGPAPLWSSFAPNGSVAWLNLGPAGEDLRKVSLERIDEPVSGEATPVATLPAGSGPMAPSPDGRHLATVAVGTNQRSQVVLVDLVGETAKEPPPIVRRTELSAAGVSGEMVWSTSERVAFTPRLNRGELVRVFDTRLQPQAAWGDWAAEHSVATADGRLLGASQGKVWQASLMAGEPTLLREIEDALVFALLDPVPPARADIPGPATPPSSSPTTTTAPARPEAPSRPSSSTSTTVHPTTTTSTAPARSTPPDDTSTTTSSPADQQAAPFPTSSGRAPDRSSSGAGWPAFVAGMLAMGAVAAGLAWQIRVRGHVREAAAGGRSTDN